ncbi:MAG: hypothetical protein CL398_01930 [Acidiferrobacteraceae bacterium]|nr:hypothetical protein [Acidiferrobacteraceae bacterium]
MHKIIVYTKELYLLLGSYKRWLPVIGILFFSISLIEIVGLGLVGWYAAILINPEYIHEDLRNIFDSFGAPTDYPQILIVIGLLLIAVFLARACISILVNYFLFQYTARVGVYLRTTLISRFLDSSYESYIQQNSSDQVTANTNFVSQYVASLTTVLKILSDMIMALSILVFLLVTEGPILFVLVGMVAFTMLLYDKILKSFLHSGGRRMNQHTRNMMKKLLESVAGFKEIQVFGRRDFFVQSVKTESAAAQYYGVRSKIIALIPRYVLEIILVTFIVSLTIAAIYGTRDLNSLIPTISVFGLAGIRLNPAASLIASGASQLRFQRHGVASLASIIIGSSKMPINNEIEARNDTAHFKSLRLSNVAYKYPQSETQVLTGIDLTLYKGQSIGLVGPSGAGKTTLVDVLLGMLAPTVGSIYVNEEKLDSTYNLKRWWKKIAYLPQDAFLTDASLRQNVAFGIFRKDIVDEDVIEALKNARLSEFLSNAPLGLDTNLGEKGLRMSGGQKQRVAIARAFYHQREVLVLDESTSALDTETENEILSEINRLKGQKTLIVIAHRLSTVRSCDYIYRLENGKVAASGTPDQVIPAT